MSAHREWVEYGKSDAFFLPIEAIRVLLPFLTASHCTQHQMEFLLCSVLYAAHSADDIEQTVQLLSATDNLLDVLTSTLQHPHPRIRLGAMTVATQMPHTATADCMIARLRIETDNKVKRLGVRSLAQMGQQLPEDLATALAEKETDWILRSYALQHMTKKPRCLFIGDGTDFANQLGDLAQKAGFEVIDGPATLMLPPIERAEREMLQTYRFVLLVRGEHFSQWGNAPFFIWLKEYVSNGGKLLATSWVSWETSGTSGFSEILPFHHIQEGYTEDVLMECQPTQHPWGQRLFPQPFVYRGSFEQLKSRNGSVTLAETSQGVPVFGYREVEQGVCYYLNTCQHTCFGEMLSPLQTSSSLREGMMRFFEMAHEETKEQSL